MKEVLVMDIKAARYFGMMFHSTPDYITHWEDVWSDQVCENPQCKSWSERREAQLLRGVHAIEQALSKSDQHGISIEKRLRFKKRMAEEQLLSRVDKNHDLHIFCYNK